MTPETEAKLRKLAVMECHHPLEQHWCIQYRPGEGRYIHPEHCTCHGTGRRFWRLVERCPRNPHFQIIEGIRHRNPFGCPSCHDAGYVLAERDLLERVESHMEIAGKWSLDYYPDSGYEYVFGDDGRNIPYSFGDGERIDAAVAVLYAAWKHETATAALTSPERMGNNS